MTAIHIMLAFFWQHALNTATLVVVHQNGIKPYLPDKKSAPNLGPLGNFFAVIGGVLIFIFMGLAFIAILWSLGKALTDRGQIKDAGKPLLVLLLLGAIGTLLELTFGVWSAVVRAF